MLKKIFKIHPYEHGSQPKIKKNLKLNTNENPYHPLIEITKNIIKEIKFFSNNIKFYPDPDSTIIKKEISVYYNIKKNEIFVGNGSDDVLSNIFLTFFKNKKILYIIDLTYSFYESFIKLYKINYKIIRINKFFSLNIKDIKDKNNNIIINNPNAPTGKFIKNIEISIILNKSKSLVVVDETYADFAGETFIKLIKNKKNILIIQSFSKSRALAGLRIGFAVANIEIIKKMNDTKNSLNSYPVNIISQISSRNIILNNLYFEKSKNKIIKNKNFLKKKLKRIGFIIINSRTNFIMTTNKKINVNELLKFLNKNNIFLRKFEIPKIENYLRISIGKLKECKILLSYINFFLKIKNI